MTDHRSLPAIRFCAELRISPEDALLVLKVANVHKDASLLGEWVEKPYTANMIALLFACLTLGHLTYRSKVGPAAV